MNYFDVSIHYENDEGDQCVNHFYGLPEILILPVVMQFKKITAISFDEADKWKLPPLTFKIGVQ